MPTALRKCTTLGLIQRVKNNCMRSIFLILVIIICAVGARAQRGGGVKWAKDGKGYYAVESNSLVRYDLPAFQRVVIADDKQLTPAGQTQPISIQAFSCSDDEKKWLLYTNSKKVWRLNTRGDYWVLDLSMHTLKQLGAGRPASTLMFAKLS